MACRQAWRPVDKLAVSRHSIDPSRGDERPDLYARSGGCDLPGTCQVRPRQRRSPRRDPGPAEDPYGLLAQPRRPDHCSRASSPTSARSRSRIGRTPAALDALQLGDALTALLPADPGASNAQGAGRAGSPGDPRRYGPRADAVRRRPDRRSGRQARGDPLREQRHDAAQLRGDTPRRSRGDRPSGRGDGHPA